MFKYHYGLKSEPALVVEKSPDLLAVRMHANSPPGLPFGVEDGQVVMTLAEAGVCVYRVPLDGGTLTARKSLLRNHRDVRFVGAVLVEPKTGQPVLYSENIFVKFIDSLSPQACLLRINAANLTVKRPLSYSTNAYFVSAPQGCGTKVFQMAAELLQDAEVDFCHPELLRPRSTKTINSNQWHLQKTTIDGVVLDASANVEAAHRVTLGEGVTIAVLNDAFDLDHLEFSDAGKVVAPRNFDRNEAPSDPRPTDNSQTHGTGVAGVACANGQYGASGVAPKAHLLPVKLNAGLGSQIEADAFIWAVDNGADVINCSWGPADGAWFDPKDDRHDAVAELPASTRLAFEYALQKGRKGKGCAIFFAAGNGNESVDNDGYASNEHVIAIAACNDTGGRSIYSDFGKAICCAFPSNDFSPTKSYPMPGRKKPLTEGIWTTDLSGDAGYDATTKVGDRVGDYTATFGGTSSAAPGAAGVAALMLAVNPDLHAKELKMLMAQSCQKIVSEIDGVSGQYDANGRCDYYGHGRLDAERAVQLAADFVRTVPA